MQPAQVDHFRAHGYVRLAGFHARKRLTPVRQQLLDELRRRRIWAAGKSLSSAWKGLPAFQQISKLSMAVKVPGLQQALMTPELLAEVAGLAGRAPSANQGTQLLLSLPRQGTWTLQTLRDTLKTSTDLPADLR